MAPISTEASRAKCAIDDTELADGSAREFDNTDYLYARVTSADGDGNALSAPSDWIFFQEND